jgi:LacI family transcriptional regulator
MLKPKRLNQLTIAKSLGVSRATVSLVLRGGKGASEETTKKVLNMARKMGYRPNALVHSIRSGKSRSIGVLVPPHDSHWQAVCYGIHDRLMEAEHLPLFLWDTEHHTQSSEAYALEQINRLLDRWVDGVILWPQFSTYYARHLHEFQSRNIPLTIIDHAEQELDADTVYSDEAMIADLAATHLASLGHRHFLNIQGPKNLGWADSRSNAVVKKLNSLRDINVITIRPEFHTNVEQEITSTLRDHPYITAVISGTDHLAKMACNAAQNLGMSVPKQLSVIGVGDLNFAKTMTPALTTINQHGYEIGKKAAQLNLERSAGILTGPARHHKIPVSLVQRSSTAPAKS